MCLCLADVVEPDGSILAQKKVYVQWRKARKLHLVIGGYAYLLPWTTLLLRCPTRHFGKGHLRWLKDGKPLAGVPHVSVTALGYVKIQQLRSSDVGIYTCVAGSAREHFVLQVIGGKKKLGAAETRQRKAGPSDGELSAALHRYDGLVEQLLQLRTSQQEGRSQAQPQDQAWGRSSLLVLIADTSRLDRLLSDGALGGQQLFQELTSPHGDANESTRHPLQGTASSTLAPLLHKPKIKAPTSKLRSPVIVRRPLGPPQPSADLVVGVGAPALLQRPVASLELRCEVLGNPQPSVTWTKNGKKLQQSSR